MFCPNCGKQLPDNVAFCDACGESVYVGFAPDDPTVSVTPPAQQTYEQPPVTQQPIEQPPMPPVQPAYTPYTPPAPKKKVGALRNLLAGIPAFFMLLLIIAASALLCVQAMFSTSTMRGFAENIVASNGIGVINFNDVEIPREAREKISELDEVEDVLIDALVNVYENSVYGTDREIISADKLIGAIKANADEIEDVSGYRITEDDYATIRREIESLDTDDLPNLREQLVEDLDIDKDALAVLDAMMSPVTVIIVLVIAAVLLVLMFLIRRFFMSTFIWGGTITLSGAILPALIAFVLDKATDYNEGTVAYVAAINNHLTPVWIGFAVAGAAMIVLGIVLSIVQKARRK